MNSRNKVAVLFILSILSLAAYAGYRGSASGWGDGKTEEKACSKARINSFNKASNICSSKSGVANIDHSSCRTEEVSNGYRGHVDSRFECTDW